MTVEQCKQYIIGVLKGWFKNKTILDDLNDNKGNLTYKGLKLGFSDTVNSNINENPIGTVIAFMGKTAPAGYLICNGATYNISSYPEFADFLKTSLGSINYFGGNGTTTFAVPDLRGEFLRGTGTATRKTGTGAAVGIHQDATRHVTIGFNNSTSVNDLFVQKLSNDSSSYTYPEDVDIFDYTNVTGTQGASVHASSRFSTSTTDRQKAYYMSRPTNTAVLYCIKVKKTVAEIEIPKIDEKEVGNILSESDDFIKKVADKIEIPDVPDIPSSPEQNIYTDTPIGTVIAFFGETPPEGYLECNGSEYLISDYPELYEQLISLSAFDKNANYHLNDFDGSDDLHFKVPDLRAEFLRGTGQAERKFGWGQQVGVHQNGTTMHWFNLNPKDSNHYLSVYGNSQNVQSNYGNADSVVLDDYYKRDTAYKFKPDVLVTDGMANGLSYMIAPKPTSTAVLWCIKAKNVVIEMPVLETDKEEIVNKLSESDDFIQKIAEKINIPDTPVSSEQHIYTDTPIGTIISFMGETPPEGYLACDGTEYLISDYPELYEQLKSLASPWRFTDYGGDGYHFKVPDLRGDFLRGTGTNNRSYGGRGSGVGDTQNGSRIYYYSAGPSSLTTYSSAIYDLTSAVTGDNYAHSETDNETLKKQHTIKYDSNAEVSYNMPLNIIMRPVNTSVLWCIKACNVEKSYSSEEHIIGTWIDGKPIYEKTYIDVPLLLSSQIIEAHIEKRDDVNILINTHGFITEYRDGNIRRCDELSTWANKGIRFFVRIDDDDGIWYSNQTFVTSGEYKMTITVQYLKKGD